MSTFFAGLNGAAQGAGGWGNLIKGAGAAVNFGSALGTVFGGGGKKADKAAELAEHAAMMDARQEIINGEIQARQDLMNAYAANKDATHTEAMAKEEALDMRRQARAMAGKQAAAAAATGAAIGVPEMDIIAEDFARMEMSAHRTLYNGVIEARGFRNQSQDLLASGEAARKTATQRAKARIGEGQARVQQIKQQRKQDVTGGIGGMIQGAAGIFGMFQGMSGKSTSGGSGAGNIFSSVASLFSGGGSGSIIKSPQGGGENFNLDF